jgi:UDP-glucose 4-epimerase
MRVLITGGAGFIGSHVVEYFQDKAEVVVLDNLRTGFKENLAGFKYEFIQASVLERETVRGAMQGVDYVFHLAAMVSVPESVEKPIECNEINAVGTLLILEEAARARVKKVVLSSSAAIYGDNPVTPKIETMMPEPKSPYAVTKLDGEYYCKMFAGQERVQAVSLRYFNVFGPRQDPQSAYAAAVPVFIDLALKNQPITIHGDGQQTRDFIFVKDIVAANVFFATQSAATGVFNVAYGRQMSVNSLAEKIRGLLKSGSPIQHVAERPGDVKHSTADISKLVAAGFTPRDNLNDGLAATIAYFQQKGGR